MFWRILQWKLKHFNVLFVHMSSFKGPKSPNSPRDIIRSQWRLISSGRHSVSRPTLRLRCVETCRTSHPKIPIESQSIYLSACRHFEFIMCGTYTAFQRRDSNRTDCLRAWLMFRYSAMEIRSACFDTFDFYSWVRRRLRRENCVFWYKEYR